MTATVVATDKSRTFVKNKRRYSLVEQGAAGREPGWHHRCSSTEGPSAMFSVHGVAILSYATGGTVERNEITLTAAEYFIALFPHGGTCKLIHFPCKWVGENAVCSFPSVAEHRVSTCDCHNGRTFKLQLSRTRHMRKVHSHCGMWSSNCTSQKSKLTSFFLWFLTQFYFSLSLSLCLLFFLVGVLWHQIWVHLLNSKAPISWPHITIDQKVLRFDGAVFLPLMAASRGEIFLLLGTLGPSAIFEFNTFVFSPVRPCIDGDVAWIPAWWGLSKDDYAQ